jgi:hypothetical protein
MSGFNQTSRIGNKDTDLQCPRLRVEPLTESHHPTGELSVGKGSDDDLNSLTGPDSRHVRLIDRSNKPERTQVSDCKHRIAGGYDGSDRCFALHHGTGCGRFDRKSVPRRVAVIIMRLCGHLEKIREVKPGFIYIGLHCRYGVRSAEIHRFSSVELLPGSGPEVE